MNSENQNIPKLDSPEISDDGSEINRQSLNTGTARNLAKKSFNSKKLSENLISSVNTTKKQTDRQGSNYIEGSTNEIKKQNTSKKMASKQMNIEDMGQEIQVNLQ